MVLLEAVPESISTAQLADELVKVGPRTSALPACVQAHACTPSRFTRASVGQIPGVEAIHELHVWQLADQRIMATVHVFIRDQESFMDAAAAIKSLFHRFGVHAATVQPEIMARRPTASAHDDGSASTGQIVSAVFVDADAADQVRPARGPCPSGMPSHAPRSGVVLLLVVGLGTRKASIADGNFEIPDTACLLPCKADGADCTKLNCCVVDNNTHRARLRQRLTRVQLASADLAMTDL